MSDYEKMYCYSRNEYQALIEASTLFSLDPILEGNAYRREKYKMVDYLAKYLFAINEEEYSQYGPEIWKLSERCIKYYDSSEGVPFLAYFMKAWDKEYRRQVFKVSQERKIGGLHITCEEKKTINSYIYRAKREGIDYLTQEYAGKVASIIGWTCDEVINVIQHMEEGTASLSITVDDEEVNILDLDNKSEWDDPTEIAAENTVISQSHRSGSVLDIIEEKFQELQDRQKPLLKKLITYELAEALMSDNAYFNKAKQYSFIDEEIINAFLTHTSISQKSIAEALGYSEQHASRSINNFMKKIREKD